MSNLLNVGEVVEFAIYIEKNGYKFYIESMKKFSDEKLLKLFQFLADEESKHEATFKRLLKKVGSFTPPESYPGEYQTYMKNFLKTHALSNDEALKKKLDSIKNAEDAVNVALDFEKDSIILFTMVKKYVQEENQSIVEGIIQEEISHILKISGYQYGK